MADELIDQVDKNDKIIGTVWKSEAHKNFDIIHREVGMVVFNDLGETLLQQRSFSKKNGPGAWKVACAGHTKAGETPVDAVNRELFEELGMKVKPIFYNKFLSRHIKRGENKESRFTWIYYAKVKNRPPIKIDKKEVNNTKWIKIKKLKDFAKENDYDLNGFSHRITMEIYKTL